MNTNKLMSPFSRSAPVAKSQYVAVRGIDTADGKRYEPGDYVPADLVDEVPWLLTRGVVKLATDNAQAEEGDK